MKKEFDYENNKSVSSVLYDWYSMVYNDEDDLGEWYTISLLPEYRFKNLEIIDCPFDEGEEVTDITITFKYDEYEKD